MRAGPFRTDLPELLQVRRAVILRMLRAKRRVAARPARAAPLHRFGLGEQRDAQAVRFVEQYRRNAVIAQDDEAVALQSLQQRSRERVP